MFIFFWVLLQWRRRWWCRRFRHKHPVLFVRRQLFVDLKVVHLRVMVVMMAGGRRGWRGSCIVGVGAQVRRYMGGRHVGHAVKIVAVIHA
jgi:hypothetical protein